MFIIYISKRLANVPTHTNLISLIFQFKLQAMSCSMPTALQHNVSFIKRKDCQMYIHTHNFPYIFVQAMFCPIAITLLHNVSFIKRKDCQMYLHTHSFPYIFVQAMSCPIATTLQHNVSFVKKKKRLSNVPTHTHHSHFPNIFVQAKNQEISLKKLQFSVQLDCKMNALIVEWVNENHSSANNR